MNVKIHNPSFGIRKINGTPDSHIRKELYGSRDGRSSIHTGIRMEREPYSRVPEKNHLDRHEKSLEKFKEWRMPEQSDGYIKAKRHGLL